MYNDPEAYTEEYQEEVTLIGELKDEQVLAIIEQHMSKAKSYTHLYRRDAGTLREIIAKDDGNKERALSLLRDLSLEQTLPFGELEAIDWGKLRDKWVELDSYTKEPIPDIDTVEGRNQEAAQIGRQLARKKLPTDASFVLSLCDAYRRLGYSEPEITKIVTLNSGHSYDEEDIWYEDGEIPSVPLQQEEEQELKPDYQDLVELQRSARKILNGIKRLATKSAERYTRLLAHLPIEQRLETIEENVRREVCRSWQATNLVKWAIGQVRTCEIQDLYIVMASAIWLDERLDEIPVPVYQDLGTFAELFGDHVLDQVIDPGWHPVTTSEDEIASIAARMEKEVLSTFEVDGDHIPSTRIFAQGVFDGVASSQSDLTSAGYGAWRHKRSRIGSIAFNATLRLELSNGTAYKEAIKKSWRAFWNAGRIVSVSASGPVVRSDATGQEQRVSWNLARWKIERKEIFLGNGDMDRLQSILSEHSWG